MDPKWEPGDGLSHHESRVSASPTVWSRLRGSDQREAAIKGLCRRGAPQEVLEGPFDGNPLRTVYSSWSVMSPLGAQAALVM